MNQLDRQLYSLFSDKTLSFGCMIKWKDSETDDFQFIINFPNDNEDFKVSFDWNYTRYPSLDDFEILGHEPQLHDVFRVAKEKWLVLNITKREWEELYCIHVYGRQWIHNGFITFINTTLPLLQQEYGTKEQLINLFK